MPLFDKASKEDNELAFRQLESMIQKRRDFEKSVPHAPKSPYELHPTTINYADIHGFSLLHYAAALGDLEKAKELVEQNADINLKTLTGNLSIVNIALAYGHCHVAQYLYENGADFTDVQPLFCKDAVSRTWLKEKIMDVRSQVISDGHFKKNFVLGGKQTQLFKPTQFMSQLARRAVEIGDIEFLQELSKQDPALFNALLEEEDADNKESKKIFVRAAENGQLDMIKFLLDKKSICSTKDFTTSPLMAAIQQNYQDVIDYLMTLDIDLHQKDNQKMTALGYTVMAGNKKTTFQLLERGAKCDQVTGTGNTILHLAILSQSLLLSDLLDRSEIKALLHTKNIYGYTPIDYALWSENKAIIELVVPLSDRGYLKQKPTCIRQQVLVEKLYYYLSSQYRDTTFLPKPDGHCNGFAFLMHLYTARGMEDYFFKTLALIANWEGNEYDLDIPFVSNEQMAYGYKNLKELFEQWINDIVWFQHDEPLTATRISRLKQDEHLAHYKFVGSPDQYNAERIYLDNHSVTTNQLRERVLYFARMPAKTQIMFSGAGHATSAFIDDKKGLHYYDPNFNLQSAIQTDPDVITQQIIDYKYIGLKRFANKIDINIQVYCPKESLEELNKVEILHEEELPNSKKEALLFQINSANHWTPLHIAVVTHSLVTFKRLVADNFCDINALDAFKLTPLKIAVENNFHEAIQFALQMPEVTLHTDLTSLPGYAYSLGHRETLDVMLARPDLFTDFKSLLMDGILNNDSDLVEKLLTIHAAKIDVTQLNKKNYGQFPLCCAHGFSNVNMFKCLLDNGVSIFIADMGSTPLGHIVSKEYTNKNHYEIIDMMLTDHNINQLDDLGFAAIHYAIQSSRFETLQHVIKKGGNIQLRTTAGASVWSILLNLPDKKDLFFSNNNRQEQRTLMRNLLITTYKFNLLDEFDKNNMHTLLKSPLKNEEINTLFEPLLNHCSSDFLSQPVMHDSLPFLIYFIREKQYNKIEPMLKKGVDVNCRYDNGNTLLMHLILSDVKLMPEKYELIHLVLAYHPDLETLQNNISSP